MLRRLVGGLAVVALGSSLLFARQGTVVTKDGHTYEGDITEKEDVLEITGVPGARGTVGIQRSNVVSTLYPDEVATQVRAALKQLKPTDIDSRIKLARVAIQSKAYDAARDAIEQAALIDPNNREVATIRNEISLHAPAPATQPTTHPTTAAATTQPGNAVGPVTAKHDVPPADFVVKRPLTPAEINRIRQMEWHPDESPAVHLQIDADTKRRFLANYVDISPAEFNRLPPTDQANLILTKGREDLRPGVKFTSDPASITEFKKSVSTALVQSCGSVGCHGGTKAGTFTLISPASNANALYTNFLVLQKYVYTVKNTQHPVIDRDYPTSSLLLQFMLPPDVAETPHPDAPGYKGAVRTKADPRYVQALHWIQTLGALPPNYDIDLSKDPPVMPPKAPGK